MLKITQNLTSSSLTIGVVLAGLALVSPDANAFTPLSVFRNTPLTAGNVKVSYVSDVGLQDSDLVNFLQLSNSDFSFQYFPIPGLTAHGSLKYTLEILNPNYYFSGVQLDSNTTTTYGSVEKKVAGLTLTSVDGKPEPIGAFANIPGQLKSLSIEDTFAPKLGGSLFFTTNQFRISPIEVPEPGTILGLVAVGGIGFISRFRKQK